MVDEALPDYIKTPLLEYLASLLWRERAVLRLRFGLEDGVFWTYEEIATQMEITKERARQLHWKAIRKSSKKIDSAKIREAHLDIIHKRREEGC
jgi:DNA-directed RNA polymerase sigma subunit (sigma70/sigma32)